MKSTSLKTRYVSAEPSKSFDLFPKIVSVCFSLSVVEELLAFVAFLTVVPLLSKISLIACPFMLVVTLVASVALVAFVALVALVAFVALVALLAVSACSAYLTFVPFVPFLMLAISVAFAFAFDNALSAVDFTAVSGTRVLLVSSHLTRFPSVRPVLVAMVCKPLVFTSMFPLESSLTSPTFAFLTMRRGIS